MTVHLNKSQKKISSYFKGGILTFPAVTICNLNEFRFNQLTRNDMYYAGEFIGFLDSNRELHPAAIPAEDIENPEQYNKIIERLAQLSDFGPSFQPIANFSLFEFYNRTGIQLNELLLGNNMTLILTQKS